MTQILSKESETKPKDLFVKRYYELLLKGANRENK